LIFDSENGLLSDMLLKALCNLTKASATIRQPATIERLSRKNVSDYREPEKEKSGF